MRIGVLRTVGSPAGVPRHGPAVSMCWAHEALIVNSEEIELRAAELASDCDLVIDPRTRFRQGSLSTSCTVASRISRARIVGSEAAGLLPRG